MRILFLLLFVVPLIELYVLIQVGEEIGALPTVLLTILTAVVGVTLMRTQGLNIMQKAQLAMVAGQLPQLEVIEGAFVFLGGIFLFLPGLLTDSIGFIFLIPVVRHFLIKRSVEVLQKRYSAGYTEYSGSFYEGKWTETTTTHKKASLKVIEGKVIDRGDSPTDDTKS